MSRRPIQDFFLFLIGSSLLAAGIFLFTNQVMVNSGFLSLGWGRHYSGGLGSSFGGSFLGFGNGQGFGLLMVPFGIGVALLLADTYRRLGWFLVCSSCAALGAAVLHSLIFSFSTTSLWSLLTMVVMIGGGGGLMFKSLREYETEPNASAESESNRDKETIKEIREELENLKKQINRKD